MKKNDGITLIALIITIIIMLILVAVTISILINSGLIGKAKKAGEDYKTSYEQEQRIGENINIDGVMYNGIDEYIATINGEDEDLAKLQEFFRKDPDVVFNMNTGGFNDDVEPIPDASTSITQRGAYGTSETSYMIISYNNKLYGIELLFNETTETDNRFGEVTRKNYSNQFTTIALQGEPLENLIQEEGVFYSYEDNNYILDFKTGIIHRHRIALNIAAVGAEAEAGRAYLYNTNGEKMSIVNEYNPRVWVNSTETVVRLSTDKDNYNYIDVLGYNFKTCRIELTIDGETVVFERKLSFPLM